MNTTSESLLQQKPGKIETGASLYSKVQTGKLVCGSVNFGFDTKRMNIL